MSDTSAILRAKIDSAEKLKSVVRTMKAMAASSIGSYENAVLALLDYERTVTLGLTACLRHQPVKPVSAIRQNRNKPVGAIVFGSDQGLVGQFNEAMTAFVIDTLDKLPGTKKLWVVGERLFARLAETQPDLVGPYQVPGSVSAISQLVGQIQIDCETYRTNNEFSLVYLFHNQPQAGAQYQPVCQQLLPLDAPWQRALASAPWPTHALPEPIGDNETLLSDLVREYLFISIYQACAESLASENASRLAAMQRAEKNIDNLSAQLQQTFSRLRQNAIDEELFDVIAGFNALTGFKD
ncbi:F-type H+-transporting ATPase subunit gamma [Oxalobacteraceae bacterium GrIS 2.11]